MKTEVVEESCFSEQGVQKAPGRQAESQAGAWAGPRQVRSAAEAGSVLGREDKDAGGWRQGPGHAGTCSANLETVVSP